MGKQQIDNENTNPVIRQSSLTEIDQCSTFTLDKAMEQFGDNVELLQLILSSKVEEDRRCTEEAKLKSKQLDYLLHQEANNNNISSSVSSPLSSSSLSPSSSTTFTRQYTQQTSAPHKSSLPLQRHRSYTPPHLTEANHAIDLFHNNKQHHMIDNYHSPKIPLVNIQPLPSINTLDRRNDKNKDIHSFFPARTTLPSLLSSSSINSPRDDILLQPDDPPTTITSSSSSPIAPPPTSSMPSSSSSPSMTYDSTNSTPMMATMNKKLPIPQIEFPYDDNYTWKNNGNTIHKKSGQRSIYYKCTNSAKGCHVNKTVTFKGQGEYLIKYRGRHLNTCARTHPETSTSTD
ncbi:uncharacterized protein BX664DRAFT_383166 [Halteromyces radiatus]|uniref:uncharacterized protein n=1 Tax=Halteromyces radiatus TaxID=101107 RepID=UPI00222066C8|nr:uncharacterized protein BX664DRAFT_383166 [Halteromyces radiatus]KAI8096772.1 hypothetical protein BX664DRAFT_383166 [Halteromyces radiatus]